MEGARANGKNFDLTLCMNGVERDLINKVVTPNLDLNSEAQQGENGEEMELDLMLSLKGKFAERRSVRVPSPIWNLVSKLTPLRRMAVVPTKKPVERTGGDSSRNGAGNNPFGIQSVSLKIEKQPSVGVAGLMAYGGNEVGENFSILEMPLVSTRWPGVNGEKVEGFLYKYKKGNEVCIICMCHGRLFSPAEFVRHGGGGDVEEPSKHIVVICE